LVQLLNLNFQFQISEIGNMAKNISSIQTISSNYADSLSPMTFSNNAGSLTTPTFAQFQTGTVSGVFCWSFSATARRDMSFNFQMPHSWVEGTSITPYARWSTTDTNTGNIFFGIEYSIASTNNTFATTTNSTVTQAVSGTAFQHQIVTFPSITMTSNLIDTIMLVHFYRDGANAADTYTGLMYLLNVGLHVQTNTLGSLQETVKF
jgi:hypothetical protein